MEDLTIIAEVAAVLRGAQSPLCNSDRDSLAARLEEVISRHPVPAAASQEPPKTDAAPQVVTGNAESNLKGGDVNDGQSQDDAG